MRFPRALVACLLLLCLSSLPLFSQQVSAPQPQPASIIGTVTDVQNDPVPGASITLTGPAPADKQSVTANDNGFFAFRDLSPSVPYRISIQAKGFADWTSPPHTLTPGQQLDLASVKIQLAVVQTTVTAVSDEQIATQEVKVAEQQRVLGIVPNFYVVYKKHPTPLTTKLKYKLAFRTTIDPINFAGAAFLAGIYQAADTPDYQQGLKGYGQRFGAEYTNTFTDIMIGGAILPSLLHQDPRYYYQGTGTVKSRIFHALSAPLITPTDSGHHQFNFSSIGGDLASGAISNLYYPSSNRGASLVFTGLLIDTSGRMVNALAQEFIFRHFTSHAKGQQ